MPFAVLRDFKVDLHSRNELVARLTSRKHLEISLTKSVFTDPELDYHILTGNALLAAENVDTAPTAGSLEVIYSYKGKSVLDNDLLVVSSLRARIILYKIGGNEVIHTVRAYTVALNVAALRALRAILTVNDLLRVGVYVSAILGLFLRLFLGLFLRLFLRLFLGLFLRLFYRLLLGRLSILHLGDRDLFSAGCVGIKRIILVYKYVKIAPTPLNKCHVGNIDIGGRLHTVHCEIEGVNKI